MAPYKRVAHSLDDLRDEVNARWPSRARVSDGALGDPAHAARVSDHNPDEQGIVRARDITEWDPGTPQDPNDDVAEVVAETLRRNKDPRIKYVIWNGRMYSSYATSSTPAWTWRKYTGANSHTKHCHVSVQPGEAGDKAGPWGIHPSTDQEGAFMAQLTEKEQRRLLDNTEFIRNQLTDTNATGAKARINALYHDVVRNIEDGEGRFGRVTNAVLRIEGVVNRMEELMKKVKTALNIK